MKKLLSLIAIVMLSISAMAQTNFRHISFAEAKAAAKAENKLIFVDFYTSWCGPCKNMANNVFPQKKVGDFMNERFVCVKYDAEKEELDLVKNTKVTAYPTFVIFDAEGNEVNRKVGGGTAESFIADMDRLSDNNLTADKIRSRYAAGERSAQLIKAYAALLTEEASNSRGKQQQLLKERDEILLAYFDNLNDKQRLSAENFFMYSEYSNKTSDKKMQYLYQNRDKVKKADKADVDTILYKAYSEELLTAAMFYYGFDKEGFPLFSQQVKTFDFISKPEYGNVLTVLEAYATGDMNKYIDAVEANAAKCGKNGFNVYYGMGNALAKADKAVKQRASKLIRSRLPEMSAMEISFIGRSLVDLEEEPTH